MNAQSENLLRDAAVALLSEFAKSEYDVVRLRAIQALAALGARNSPALVEALLDDDEDVRQDAATALGQLGVEQAVPQLLENLIHDPCGEVKLACVTALAKLGAADAAPYLRTLVTGRGDEIVWDEDEYHQDEWDDWLDTQIAAIRAVGTLGDAVAIEPIVRAVMDEEAQELGDVACEALGRIGAAAIPTLGVFASSPKRRLRYHAVRALAEIGGSEARAILRKALSDEDGGVRLLAHEALMEHDPQLVEAALTDPQEDIRLAALARAGLSEPELLDRMMRDPGSRVQLALIERLDRTSPIADTDDLRWQVLDFLSTGEQPEVAAQALGLLAALAPELMTDRLKTLFAATPDQEQAERDQWAVVDALARSPVKEAAEWLQRACRSPFRSVRLKALATLGMIVTEEGRAHVNQQQGRELLLSLALSPMPVAEEKKEDTAEIEEAPRNDIQALEEAGLDVSHGGENGPTSSLGAILGHDAIAAEMQHEAEQAEEMPPLSPREQALLARATRQPKRRRVALDDDAEALEHESRMTAIRLLGEVRGMQAMLAQIVRDPDPEAAQQALGALGNAVARHGAELSMEQLAGIATDGLSTADSATALQALKLLRQAALPPLPELRGKLRAILRTGEAPFRIEAMQILCAWDESADAARELLDDPSASVRQASMRLISEMTPEEAGAVIVPFLLANPDQRILTYIGDNPQAKRNVAGELMQKLRDHDRRATWPVMIAALADLLSQPGPAV
ncbi:HEAT repeat [Ruegeria intermedia]|uniref:HEAT repeat n=1 Tax=Ruegeria intermedia TaxID=996115 RepID=A0A1M4ZQX7_9RHOB|nr:HEAT repeat domain-containing protein [Ruegeria intermedia]SHF20207.1 HEAT repeat [Ruegeria intermedia]